MTVEKDGGIEVFTGEERPQFFLTGSAKGRAEIRKQV
jgi:hypothetical protein